MVSLDARLRTESPSIRAETEALGKTVTLKRPYAEEKAADAQGPTRKAGVTVLGPFTAADLWAGCPALVLAHRGTSAEATSTWRKPPHVAGSATKAGRTRCPPLSAGTRPETCVDARKPGQAQALFILFLPRTRSG